MVRETCPFGYAAVAHVLKYVGSSGLPALKRQSHERG